MATQAQITANRQNAQRSTGPRTHQGKLATSQNAIKHGLSAEKNIIESENQADFDLHRAQFLDELAPSTPMELMLVDRVINLSWQLKRASNIQNHAIDALSAQKTQSPISRLAQSILSQTSDPDSPPATEGSTLGQTIVKDFEQTRVLERLLMYERRIEHSLYKTIMEIQRLNMIKKLDPPAA
ncbi:MAG: hypothetical protein KAJ07_11035 [Planctomycetes bacterium]|nr:hypothetical protein [Planctomycetota bacterium]